MKFRTIPPDAGELSCVNLLWPSAVLAGSMLFAGLSELTGHPWSVHSDVGGPMMLLFALSTLVGIVVSIVTLASVLPALRRYPSLRSRRNLVCAGISLAYVVFVLGLVACANAYLILPS